MRHWSRVALGIVVVAATGVLGACGDDGDAGPDLRPRDTQPSGGGDSTSTSEPPATETSTTTTPDDGATTSTEPLGEPTLDERSSVSTTGLDTVTFGMTIAQAERAAGTRLVRDDAASKPPACIVVAPESGPQGVTFTVTSGTIERVDIRPPATIGTRSGIRIGSNVAELQRVYGDRVGPSPAEPGAFVFTPRDEADAAFRLVFATDGNAITAYRSGRVPQVESVNPC